MPHKQIAIFCQVVDNYGDIGVCWRLARQWAAAAADANLHITLWVDDLTSFKCLCAAADPQAAYQQIDGVALRLWSQTDAKGFDSADVVIEAFGCNLPESVIARMQQLRPVWINLEYLSAEAWVESCHGAASPHISGLTKYFFFPGFSPQTGGLLAERNVIPECEMFQANAHAIAQWWQRLGWPARPDACVISLFCYPHAPLVELFALWAQSTHPVVCLVPQGVAMDALEVYLQQKPDVGMRFIRGALTLQIIPFVDQPEYDRLLWAADINFVRGEDSFVRAQWAARPFIWHIYPQTQAAHLEKLRAFIQRHTADLPPSMQTVAADLSLAWNLPDLAVLRQVWPEFIEQLPKWQQHARTWRDVLALNGNLADKLLLFIQKIV
jgi:uncharacterized repeat protein (TIGR03837 family)